MPQNAPWLHYGSWGTCVCIRVRRVVGYLFFRLHFGLGIHNQNVTCLLLQQKDYKFWPLATTGYWSIHIAQWAKKEGQVDISDVPQHKSAVDVCSRFSFFLSFVHTSHALCCTVGNHIDIDAFPKLLLGHPWVSTLKNTKDTYCVVNVFKTWKISRKLKNLPKGEFFGALIIKQQVWPM